jgi:ketosteroid isomerase-like protein
MSANIDTVRAIYAAFAQGDVPAILGHFAADIEWEHDWPDCEVPWMKPRRGRAQVAEYFTALQALEIEHFEPLNFLAGGNQVAVPARIAATVRASGRPIRDLELHLWTFDDEGRVSRFRHFGDTRQHHEACRPPG